MLIYCILVCVYLSSFSLRVFFLLYYVPAIFNELPVEMFSSITREHLRAAILALDCC